MKATKFQVRGQVWVQVWEQVWVQVRDQEINNVRKVDR